MYTHGKRRIQWWTITTVVFVFLERFSVSGALLFTGLCWIYVVSGSSVQMDEQLAFLKQTTDVGSFVDRKIWRWFWIFCNFAMLAALPLYWGFKTSSGVWTLYCIGMLATIFLPMEAVAGYPAEVKNRSKGKEKVGVWYA
jgi:hypothetical protein